MEKICQNTKQRKWSEKVTMEIIWKKCLFSVYFYGSSKDAFLLLEGNRTHFYQLLDALYNIFTIFKIKFLLRKQKAYSVFLIVDRLNFTVFNFKKNYSPSEPSVTVLVT